MNTLEVKLKCYLLNLIENLMEFEYEHFQLVELIYLKVIQLMLFLMT